MGRIRHIDRKQADISTKPSGSTNTADFNNVNGWFANIDEDISWNLVCQRTSDEGGIIRFVRCKPFAQSFHVEQEIDLAPGENQKIVSFVADNEDQFFVTGRIDGNGKLVSINNGDTNGSAMLFVQVRGHNGEFGSLDGDDFAVMGWNNPAPGHRMVLVPNHNNLSPLAPLQNFIGSGLNNFVANTQSELSRQTIERINQYTNYLAEEIIDIRDQISNEQAQLSGEGQTITNRLTEIAKVLEQIGNDPNDPAPIGLPLTFAARTLIADTQAAGVRVTDVNRSVLRILGGNATGWLVSFAGEGVWNMQCINFGDTPVSFKRGVVNTVTVDTGQVTDIDDLDSATELVSVEPHSQRTVTFLGNRNLFFFSPDFSGEQGVSDAFLFPSGQLDMSWNAFAGQDHTNHKIEITPQ